MTTTPHTVDRPAAGRPDNWFRVHHRSDRPRLRLVCFPHAGGTAQLFHGWPARLPSDIEVLAVRYPGRQDRVAEPCVDDMGTLADAVAAALEPHLDRPLALFGHSMGAAVAYEVALRLEARPVVPVHVLVSAHVPGHRADRSHLDDDTDEALIARVRRLGDLHSEVYDIPELRELLLPALRADHRLLRTYRPERARPLRAPITAYTGTDDSSCALDDIRAWADLTGADNFELRSFPGDHFYLVPREADLLADIAERLRWYG
jgi:pyochelin biosynthetic protein PchC